LSPELSVLTDKENQEKGVYATMQKPLTPGTILSYEWGIRQETDDGTPHVWEVVATDGGLAAVRKLWNPRAQVIDKATGEPVSDVESYNPITGELVRFVIGSNGEPMHRTLPGTRPEDGKYYLVKMVETRDCEVRMP
jgi:hypothetical protein